MLWNASVRKADNPTLINLLTFDLARRLYFIVFKPTVFAAEGHDDDFAKKWY